MTFGELALSGLIGAMAVAVVSLGCSVVRRKSPSGWGWFLVCPVGGLVALIVLLALPTGK